jgi:hypothetical protein
MAAKRSSWRHRGILDEVDWVCCCCLYYYWNVLYCILGVSWLGFFVLQGILFSAFVSIELRILCAVVHTEGTIETWKMAGVSNVLALGRCFLRCSIRSNSFRTSFKKAACLTRFYSDGKPISRFPVPEISSLANDVQERMAEVEEKVSEMLILLRYSCITTRDHKGQRAHLGLRSGIS